MIPKILHTIWVGPKPAPLHWINTWREKHPDWTYMLWDNEAIFNRFFINQKHLDWYREKSIWHGVADVARYEILYQYGGLMPGADSECLHPVDELLTDQAFDAYAVYENETVRPGLVTPLYACTPHNEFASALIDGLKEKDKVGVPWKTTGNVFMQETIARLNYPRLKIWPSYMFNPVHHTGLAYQGNERIYAVQNWGTTKNSYAV